MPNTSSNIPQPVGFAEELLFKMLENASDADLERAYKAIEAHRTKYFCSHRALMLQPFANEVLTLIDEQYRYRNQDMG